MLSVPYFRGDAVAYARRWALGRSPAYYDFSALGGDCTNFVSQCLFAGTGVMNLTPQTGWYYFSPDDRAPAWTSVVQLHRFLTENTAAGPYADQVPADRALPGDVVQLANEQGRFYHSLLILSTAPRILVAAHSEDALYRPLASYSYASARFLHILGARLP